MSAKSLRDLDIDQWRFSARRLGDVYMWSALRTQGHMSETLGADCSASCCKIVSCSFQSPALPKTEGETLGQDSKQSNGKANEPDCLDLAEVRNTRRKDSNLRLWTANWLIDPSSCPTWWCRLQSTAQKISENQESWRINALILLFVSYSASCRGVKGSRLAVEVDGVFFLQTVFSCFLSIYASLTLIFYIGCLLMKVLA